MSHKKVKLIRWSLNHLIIFNWVDELFFLIESLNLYLFFNQSQQPNISGISAFSKLSILTGETIK